MTLLINDSNNIILENFSEEEKENDEEKENEEIEKEEDKKEEDKKEFFLSSLINSNSYKATSITIGYFIEITSMYSLEIQLPPPEYNV